MLESQVPFPAMDIEKFEADNQSNYLGILRIFFSVFQINLGTAKHFQFCPAFLVTFRK
jgi:hypothetical protein